MTARPDYTFAISRPDTRPPSCIYGHFVNGRWTLIQRDGERETTVTHKGTSDAAARALRDAHANGATR